MTPDDSGFDTYELRHRWNRQAIRLLLAFATAGAFIGAGLVFGDVAQPMWGMGASMVVGVVVLLVVMLGPVLTRALLLRVDPTGLTAPVGPVGTAWGRRRVHIPFDHVAVVVVWELRRPERDHEPTTVISLVPASGAPDLPRVHRLPRWPVPDSVTSATSHIAVNWAALDRGRLTRVLGSVAPHVDLRDETIDGAPI
ncbi:hypothetical protein ACWGR4_33240 [Embleya sp. NPDC055664]